MPKYKISGDKAFWISFWWSRQLFSRSKLDNGNNSTEEAIALLEQVIDVGLPKPVFSDVQVIRFQYTLKTLLLEKQPDCLVVDYCPDSILSAALAAARLPSNALPIKTVLDIPSMRCREGDSGEWKSFPMDDLKALAALESGFNKDS